MAQPKLWAIGPTVVRGAPNGSRHYVHNEPVLHRVFIREVGGIGEPNAGEFLIETPCGYTGWVRQLNKNPDKRHTCEACLNGAETKWMRHPLPDGAVAAEAKQAAAEWFSHVRDIDDEDIGGP